MLNWLIPQTIDGLTLGGVYALIALGYSLVYGVMRFINFAHGDVYMVGAVTGFGAAALLGWNKTADDQIGLATACAVLVLSILACMMLGYCIERFAYRPIRKAPRLNSLITAIGVSFLLENIFQLPIVFGARPRTFPSVKLPSPSFHVGGFNVRYEQVLILAGTIFFLLVCRHIILKTRMGLGIRAVSYHHLNAQLMGVNVNRVASLTFMLGSSLAAIAGVLDRKSVV